MQGGRVGVFKKEPSNHPKMWGQRCLCLTISRDSLSTIHMNGSTGKKIKKKTPKTMGAENESDLQEFRSAGGMWFFVLSVHFYYTSTVTHRNNKGKLQVTGLQKKNTKKKKKKKAGI